MNPNKPKLPWHTFEEAYEMERINKSDYEYKLERMSEVLNDRINGIITRQIELDSPTPVTYTIKVCGFMENSHDLHVWGSEQWCCPGVVSKQEIEESRDLLMELVE